MQAKVSKVDVDKASAEPAEIKAAGEVSETAPIGLKGHIDALDNGRVFGWAWSPDDPQARLDIILFVSDEEVAHVVADKPRIDLRRNAVGDGSHAFDVELPGDVADRPLRVLARHSSGEEIELNLPGDPGKAIPALASTAFGIALDRLDFLMSRLHRMQAAHHGLTKELRQLGQGLAPAPVDEAAKPDTEERLVQIDTVLLRLDRTLADFDQRLHLLSRKHIHGVAPQLLGIAGLVGIVVGIGLTLGFGR